MQELKANERTFQGVLLSAFNKIIDESADIKFDSVFQELNVGVGEYHFKVFDRVKLLLTHQINEQKNEFSHN